MDTFACVQDHADDHKADTWAQWIETRQINGTQVDNEGEIYARYQCGEDVAIHILLKDVTQRVDNETVQSTFIDAPAIKLVQNKDDTQVDGEFRWVGWWWRRQEARQCHVDGEHHGEERM